jgi:osmotically-inducible protein OsmY
MVSLANGTVPVPDRDLEHRVAHFLHNRNVSALRHIVVQAESGRITLRGTVTSFYQKQLCIQACRDVPGVSALIDEVEVDSIM